MGAELCLPNTKPVHRAFSENREHDGHEMLNTLPMPTCCDKWIPNMELSTLTLSPEAKREILSTFFNYETTPLQAQQLGESYFRHYCHSLRSSGLECSSVRQERIFGIIDLLKQADTNRTNIVSRVKKQYSEEDGDDDDAEIVRDSLNLAIRLLLMIPIGPFLATGGAITVSGETYSPWREGTIAEFVSTVFAPRNAMRERVRLEKGFNARNLKRIAGIEIRWTSNLADHLRMRDDDTAVELFHYASFLRFHQDWSVNLRRM